MNYALSKRAEESNPLNVFFGGAADSIKDQIDFKNKPFETIFNMVGPGMLMGINPILGILFAFVNANGDGLSQFAAKLDKYFGFGDNKKPDVSESKVQDVSESLVDEYFKEGTFLHGAADKAKEVWDFVKEKLGITASLEMLLIIKEAKGYITEDDIFSVCTSNRSNLIKEAWGTPKVDDEGMLKNFLKFQKSGYGHQKSLLVRILFWFLKSSIVGILMLGAAGGASALIGDATGLKPYKSTTTNTSGTGSYAPPGVGIGGNLKPYTNTQGDVGKTMLEFLNAEFDFQNKTNTKTLSFSEKFYETYGINIERSPQMKKLLQNILFANGGGSLSEMSSWRVFNAPDLDTVSNLFLPGITTGEPKAPVVKAPVAKATGQDDLAILMARHYK